MLPDAGTKGIHEDTHFLYLRPLNQKFYHVLLFDRQSRHSDSQCQFVTWQHVHLQAQHLPGLCQVCIDVERTAISACANSVRFVLEISGRRTGGLLGLMHGIQIMPDSYQLVRLGTTLRNAKPVSSRLREIWRVTFARTRWWAGGLISSQRAVPPGHGENEAAVARLVEECWIKEALSMHA